MRVIIQRVKEAKVSVSNEVISEISQGLLLYVAFSKDDTSEISKTLADKLCKLRVFENNKIDKDFDLSIKQIEGQILSVSQFTLNANLKKGNRPNFHANASFNHANRLYDKFNEALRTNVDFVAEGKFGADMKVYSINDGPVTFILDSDDFI